MCGVHVVEFMPGVKLTESFYKEVLKDLIEDSFPDL